MLTPPPVSVEGYPSKVGSEENLNYLQAGVTFYAGYIDNQFVGFGNDAIRGETTFSIRPTISFDATSYRQHSNLLYSPGFTFYQPTNELNQTDQNLTFNYSFRLTPHAAIAVNDYFQQGASSFNSSSFGAAGSGAAPASGIGIVAPFQQRLTNTADAQYSLQFDLTNMVGVFGGRSDLHYPDTAEVPGLYNSNESGGGGFYNHRLARTQYVGASYKYSRISASPAGGRNETQTHTAFLFYTIYLRPGLSFSLSGGPQEYDTEASAPSATSPASGVRGRAHMASVGSEQAADAQTQTVTASGWSPGVTASMGWQESRTNFSAVYSHTIGANEGLLGTFDANNGGVSARWRASRTWTLGLNAMYSSLKNVTSVPFFISTAGGHSIGGTATVEHPLGRKLGISFEYDHLHQNYGGITVVQSNPDIDRGLVSVYCQFTRPLGK